MTMVEEHEISALDCILKIPPCSSSHFILKWMVLAILLRNLIEHSYEIISTKSKPISSIFIKMACSSTEVRMVLGQGANQQK